MKIIFSDFDGTLTTPSGLLESSFFDVLKLIESSNSELVIVSGRSLSWGHFLLSHFEQLRYVIMEGGGVILSRKDNGSIEEEILLYDESVEELQALTQRLLLEVPGVVLSFDSFGRKTDRAVEYHLMSEEAIIKTQEFLKANGANFSQSNVHINFWIGDISKNYAVDYFFKNYLNNISKEDCIYYGDSLNDESMFEHFPNTVGVSNIAKVIDKLTFRPKIILEGKDFAGVNGMLRHLKEVFN